MVSGRTGFMPLWGNDEEKTNHWWVIIFMVIKVQKPFTGEL
jgi:hypothetical protein